MNTDNSFVKLKKPEEFRENYNNMHEYQAAIAMVEELEPVATEGNGQ